VVDLFEGVLISDLPDAFAGGQLKMVAALGADLEVGIQVLGKDRLVALIALNP